MQNTPTTALDFADKLNWLSLRFRILPAALRGQDGDARGIEAVEAMAMDLVSELAALAETYDGAEWGSQAGRTLTGRAIVEALADMPESELRPIIEAVAKLREALADA